MNWDRTYAAIDLKSFYASVECRERGLDPLNTNLVVADKSRTDKTICLAVTPTLKKYGLSGRSRLYEVVGKVREINKIRKSKIFGKFNSNLHNKHLLQIVLHHIRSIAFCNLVSLSQIMHFSILLA